MPERSFQCTPTAWNRDAVLNSITWESDYVFRRIALECDRFWRIEVDPKNEAQSIRCRAFEPERRFVAWSLPKIVRCLQELKAAGVVRKLIQGERCWIEVAERLQYHKGRDPTRPEEAEQRDLEMAQGLFALPPPEQVVRDVSNIPMRVESESEKTKTDSARARADEDSERFARDEESLPDDELWGLLCRELGGREMVKNGAMWQKRLKLERTALRVAVFDYKTKSPDQRAGMNAAAYITAAFEGEKRRRIA